MVWFGNRLFSDAPLLLGHGWQRRAGSGRYSKTKPKILLAHDYPPVTGGGLARHTVELAVIFGEEYDFTILTTRLVDHFTSDDSRNLSKYNIKTLEFSFRGLLKFRAICSEYDAIIINTTYSIRFSLICFLFLERYLKKKSICVFHTEKEHIDFNRFRYLPKAFRFFLRSAHDWAAKKAHVCTTFSIREQERLQSWGRKNVRFLPMPIRFLDKYEENFEKRFLRNKVRNCVGFAGELSRIKGADRILALRSSMPAGISLTICGCGPMSDDFPNTTANDTLGSIDFIDFVEPNEMWSFYDKIDILLVPSRVESLSRVSIEAIASGVLVLASPVGGLAELIKGAFGPSHLVDFDNPIETAKKIQNLLHDREEIASKARRAKKWVEINYAQYKKRWREILKEVIEIEPSKQSRDVGSLEYVDLLPTQDNLSAGRKKHERTTFS